MHRAGLNESAAAGILNLAGWPDRARMPPLCLGCAQQKCNELSILFSCQAIAAEARTGCSIGSWPLERLSWPHLMTGLMYGPVMNETHQHDLQLIFSSMSTSRSH